VRAQPGVAYCWYCAKRAVRRGVCKRTANVGELDVCGRHFHCIVQPNQNIGRRAS